MNLTDVSKSVTGKKLLCVMTLWVVYSLAACKVSESRKSTTSASPGRSELGQHLYIAYCASCHGVDGKGNGPASMALRIKPADLTQLAKNANGVFPAQHVYSMASGEYMITAHGSTAMPIWGPAFLAHSGNDRTEVEQNIKDLVSYIELLQKDLVAALREGPAKP